ncbi:hypothetical protein ACVIN2_006624 [Bradyrhizobium sp. USDA 3650]
MIDGIANITRKLVTSMAQTNSGMRSSVMPGARSLNTVTTISTETASAATSVNVIICAQTSTRLVGVNCRLERGTYENQPTSGPTFSAKEIHRKQPPNRNIQ